MSLRSDSPSETLPSNLPSTILLIATFLYSLFVQTLLLPSRTSDSTRNFALLLPVVLTLSVACNHVLYSSVNTSVERLALGGEVRFIRDRWSVPPPRETTSEERKERKGGRRKVNDTVDSGVRSTPAIYDCDIGVLSRRNWRLLKEGGEEE